MENLVSKSRLLWQQLHTTPPPVVLSLYLQNAQLSPKPALCWEETAVSLSLFSLSLTLARSLLLKTIIKHIYAPPQLCRGWVGVARDAFKPRIRLSVCVYRFGRIWTFGLGEKDSSELETYVLLEHGWCCHYSTSSDKYWEWWREKFSLAYFWFNLNYSNNTGENNIYFWLHYQSHAVEKTKK